MKTIIDNASGPSGIIGITAAKITEPGVIFSFIPQNPAEWLIFLSTCLIICQLINWGWRFMKWIKK
jgi:hypothetical protein